MNRPPSPRARARSEAPAQTPRGEPQPLRPIVPEPEPPTPRPGRSVGRRRRGGRGGGSTSANASAPAGSAAPPRPAQPQPARPAVAKVAGPKAAGTKAAGTKRRRGRSAVRKVPDVRIGVGVVVRRGDELLLVRERGRWSLPKGGLDPGELLQEGARRECQEETGLDVRVGSLAFVVEFHARSWGHHLQFFYEAQEIGGTLGPRDPDREVQEARFVPLGRLREFLRFRPRLLALEAWLEGGQPQQLVFNLDEEPAMLRRDQMLPRGG